MSDPFDPRVHKYNQRNDVSGYYTRAPLALKPFITEKAFTLHHDVSDVIKSVQVNATQRERNRSQVVRKENVIVPPIQAGTMYLRDFIDQKFWQHPLAEHQEKWQASFDEYALVDNQQSSEKAIRRDDLAKVVKNCIGDDVPEFVLDKFKALGQIASVERKIYWSDFRKLLQRAYELIKAELNTKTETPGLIQLMNKPRLADEDMGPLGEGSTMYRDTFCHAGSNTFKRAASANLNASLSRTLPKTMSDTFSRQQETEIDPASADLFSGTSKGTYQLPGYTGHIPANKRNIRKVEHSFGMEPRPKKNDLLVTRCSIGCVAGYTGYISSNAPVFSERATSCDPRVSNGAAYGADRRML